MREIVLDTETTGLDPETGDRIVEIGCIELINHVPTGETLHRYINPERDMPLAAFEIHGLSTEFLSQHPVFAAVADELLDFLGDARLVIHNAGFDMRFLNKELELAGKPMLAMNRALDTVAVARRKYPGAQVSLDALCRRFEIDNGHRSLHGALLDADLLAAVYLELIGGRQPELVPAGGEARDDAAASASSEGGPPVERPFREPRAHLPTPGELAAHSAFLDKIKDPIWSQGPEQGAS